MMMKQIIKIEMETVNYLIGKKILIKFSSGKCFVFSVQTTCFRDREIHNRLEKHR